MVIKNTPSVPEWRSATPPKAKKTPLGEGERDPAFVTSLQGKTQHGYPHLTKCILDITVRFVI